MFKVVLGSNSVENAIDDLVKVLQERKSEIVGDKKHLYKIDINFSIEVGEYPDLQVKKHYRGLEFEIKENSNGEKEES